MQLIHTIQLLIFCSVDLMEGVGDLSSKKCPLCNFDSPNVPLLLSHLRSVHSSDPNFLVTCGLSGCTVSSKSFSALYSHIYRHHHNIGIVNRRHTPVTLLQTSDISLSNSELPDKNSHPPSDSSSDGLVGIGMNVLL